MPILSYQKRFAEKVRTGEKLGTIRTPRKHLIKPGDTLYHYTGPYGPGREKVGESVCSEVRKIVIFDDAVLVSQSRLVERKSGTYLSIVVDYEINKPDALDTFAKADGFDDWNSMLSYFKDKINDTLWWIRWEKESLKSCG